jgi:hypothetical protein
MYGFDGFKSSMEELTADMEMAKRSRVRNDA